MQGTVVKSGIGFGSALAIVISYTAHKSVLWAIIHGIFSWFSVVYFLIKQ
jgi:ABC-type Fe3+-siderophore transport system permease subunit